MNDPIEVLQRQISLQVKTDMVLALLSLCQENATLRKAVMDALRKQVGQVPE